MTRSATPLDDRFWAKVDRRGPDECWLWRAELNHGYGIFWLDGGRVRAHRAVYEATVGPIADGLQVDHLCRNPSCVNPRHLEAVTARENTLRSSAPSALNARKTVCKRGHPFDEANTYYHPRGDRQCRACNRGYAMEAYRARTR